MWASVAPAWGEHAESADTRGVAVTARLLELSALRPGRVAVAVWGPRARNPWLGVVFDAVSACATTASTPG